MSFTKPLSAVRLCACSSTHRTARRTSWRCTHRGRCWRGSLSSWASRCPFRWGSAFSMYLHVPTCTRTCSWFDAHVTYMYMGTLLTLLRRRVWAQSIFGGPVSEHDHVFVCMFYFYMIVKKCIKIFCPFTAISDNAFYDLSVYVTILRQTSFCGYVFFFSLIWITGYHLIYRK